MKYVYFILRPCGFNDQLSSIRLALDYCNKTGRSLIINKSLPLFCHDLTRYFNLPINKVIYDPIELKNIIYDNDFTIYLDIQKEDVIDMVSKKYKFGFERPFYTYKSKILRFPMCDVSENLIIFGGSTGGGGYPLFKDLIFKPEIKKIINDRYNKLIKPYIAIQIRNTDYKSDYEVLYENNKDEINSAIEIYIATDDKNALAFFIDKGLPVKNFTTYPSKDKYKSLHTSDIDPHTKFIDMLSDIYICGMSDKLISSSVGGFIRLIRACNKNKPDLAKQFEIID